ncbi:flagellar hook-associated protein FlgK [Haematobacter missouriensis]|uniref:flagellar hook-associated protein FlgK n=1 Tax=Haematobacter missouriensis TaxID=366616 RepID=UPI0023F45A9E|nr:flagellar hook-associated protein FlgK [Haematobacter missouriensis]
MSISQALSNAASGLSVVGRTTSVVSANLANSLTPGYSRQEVVVSNIAGNAGTGVRVTAVLRDVDPALTLQRLKAQSEAAGTGVEAAFLKALEDSIGTSDSGDSLSARLARLGASLTMASSVPSSESRLADVLSAAKALAEKINGIGQAAQEARATADQKLAADVGMVNANLSRIDELNRAVVAGAARGSDINTLLDERQRLVDGIADALPVRQTLQDDGRISLHLSDGTTLLEGSRVAKLGFSSAGDVTPATTVENGLLSGVTLDGKPLSLGAGGRVGEGRIAAQLTIRDQLAPALQSEADALAGDLIARFDAAAKTLAPDGEGLFRDASGTGGAGLAGRLVIAADYDPDQGGALWRIRNGAGTTTERPGDAGGLIALSTAMEKEKPLTESAAALLSGVATRRLSVEMEASFSRHSPSGLPLDFKIA